MPEIDPSHSPMPRTALYWDGTLYTPALVDAAKHLQVDVLTGGVVAPSQAGADGHGAGGSRHRAECHRRGHRDRRPDKRAEHAGGCAKSRFPLSLGLRNGIPAAKVRA